jgi:hypothetical protein
MVLSKIFFNWFEKNNGVSHNGRKRLRVDMQTPLPRKEDSAAIDAYQRDSPSQDQIS